MPVKLMTISGSLRSASSNTAALRALAEVAPPDVGIVAYQGLAALPAFNPDLDGDLMPAEARLARRLVGEADALVISSPEYARGMAGSMKNMLDWLVGGPEFDGKPVALVSTSQRAEHAPAQLRLVLATMSGIVVEQASITLPLLGKTMSHSEIAASPELRLGLLTVLDGLRSFLDGGRG